MASQASETSQTAQDYIVSQLSLEADAREALPYQFDTCTQPLGPLRQSVYACLTCTPPPASKFQQFTPAGVCYSCSISCHGEHNLVELFGKRDFECDCGTTKMSNSGTVCNLRLQADGKKGGVTGQTPREGNRYNQNYEGRFCGCGEEYDPEKEKGTMFQCLGLGPVEDGGCGEDWWHPECLMGLPRRTDETGTNGHANGQLETVKEETDANEQSEEQPDGHDGVPAGFPQEDDFDHLICYKCANAFPWIKQYAGTPGFLPAVAADGALPKSNGQTEVESKKRKAEDDAEERPDNKKVKSDSETLIANTQSETAPSANINSTEAAPVPTTQPTADTTSAAKHITLPSPPTGPISLFVKEDFRDHLCRCADCFSRLSRHPQLLDEEETYEPPRSESDAAPDNASTNGRSIHSGSLLDRGEAALSSMDRVRAIEGVMAYNHVRDKVKAFLQPFAESGQAVGAEDIKAYFAKLRGDEQSEREAKVGAGEDGAVQGDGRRKQDGY